MKLNKLVSFLALGLLASVAEVSAAGLLAPGYDIVGVAATPGSATSAIAVPGTLAGVNNYPAAESPDLGIDGVSSTKYLNFAKTNTGFIVTIPGSLTTVTGLQFTAANDAPERDPVTVTIEGTTTVDPSTAAAGAAVAFLNGGSFNTYRVLVTAVRNAAAANSMQFSEVQLLGGVMDTTAPTVFSTTPPGGAAVRELRQVEVLFSEPVDGVDASDLLVNGVPATGITYGTPNQFSFDFPEPAPGRVTFAFAPNHGIRDQAAIPNTFAGYSWTNTLDPNLAVFDVRINEFLADNENGIRDEDGSREDWLELYNGGSTPVNLAGWFLTDDTLNLTKWRFPAVQLAANGYLRIWASNKDRTNDVAALHTNFKLEKNGEFLGLVLPDGSNVVSSFAPAYPEQRTDASYGRDRLDPNIVGFYATPTPGAANSIGGPGSFSSDVV